MSITLVTGTPGAGKTLKVVGELLPAELASPVASPSGPIPRRLCVGGIPGLLVDHEPIEVPHIKATDPDLWGGASRLPGEPPVRWVSRRKLSSGDYEVRSAYPSTDEEAQSLGLVPVVARADNWWLWCEPGDVIVIDEAWQAFPSLPSGRKLPDHIDKLAVHRHYGIDVLLIGQGPAQFHVHVRALVGRHLFLRRMWGGSSAVVYEWDHCASHTAVRTATKAVFRHRRKYFSLYQSSQLHIKPRASVPFAVPFILFALVALPVGFFYVKGRVSSYSDPARGAAAPPGLGPLSPASASSSPDPGQLLPVAFSGRPVFTMQWPADIAGCWQTPSDCVCASQGPRVRLLTDRPALCNMVAAGVLAVPDARAAPTPPLPSPPASAVAPSLPSS